MMAGVCKAGQPYGCDVLDFTKNHPVISKSFFYYILKYTN